MHLHTLHSLATPVIAKQSCENVRRGKVIIGHYRTRFNALPFRHRALLTWCPIGRVINKDYLSEIYFYATILVFPVTSHWEFNMT